MPNHVTCLTWSAACAAMALVVATPLAHAQQAEDETPEQVSYEGRMDREIRTWIHDGNHQATDDERKVIDEHWKRAARLWRIRKLAGEVHDAPTIKRVDSLLARADHAIESELRRFREHAPVMTEAPPVFEVLQAPPPPQTETQGAPPAPGQVWMPGFWGWNGQRHVWNTGRWSAPPQPGMKWEIPEWKHRGDGKWIFQEGRWSAPVAAANVVYEPPPAPAQAEEVDTAPPPPMVEMRPPAPPNGVWIPGYWHFNSGRHVWIAGRWSAAKPGMQWQPDHWVREGRRWKLERGHWAK